MKAKLSVRISPADTGRRVSVRSRIAGEPGGPSATDAVGRLLGWEDGVLRIERRDGSVATIREGDLLAGKILDEPPPRRRGGYPS